MTELALFQTLDDNGAWLVTARAPLVELPIATTIRHEEQRSIRAPSGLGNTLLASLTSKLHRLLQRSINPRCNEHLGSRPRHIGMVPLNPRDPVSSGVKPRMGVKVRSRDHNLDRFLDAVDQNELIDCLPGALVLPDGQNEFGLLWVRIEIRVVNLGVRLDSSCHAAGGGVENVDPVGFPVVEDDISVRDGGKGSSAVAVDRCARTVLFR